MLDAQIDNTRHQSHGGLMCSIGGGVCCHDALIAVLGYKGKKFRQHGKNFLEVSATLPDKKRKNRQLSA